MGKIKRLLDRFDEMGRANFRRKDAMKEIAES